MQVHVEGYFCLEGLLFNSFAPSDTLDHLCLLILHQKDLLMLRLCQSFTYRTKSSAEHAIVFIIFLSFFFKERACRCVHVYVYVFELCT